MDLDYIPHNGSDSISPKYPGYLIERSKKLLRQMRKKFPPSQNFAIQSTGEPARNFSLYTGYGGNLYLYWRLNLITGNFEQELELSARVVINELGAMKGSSTSFLKGKAGLLAILAVKYKEVRFVDIILEDLREMPKEYEVLYGAAGTLYVLGFVLKYWPEVPLKDRLIEKIQAISRRILSKKNSRNHLKFRWPADGGKRYIGAAHGTIGILHILLQVRDYLPNYDTIFTSTIEYIINMQFESGNFPSRKDNPKDEIVHFCHGGPGAVPMLCLAAKIFNNQFYLNSALAAGNDIWHRGILKKGRGICHGISGNGYSLLSLYKATNNPIWLNRALIFAEKMCLDSETDNIISNYNDPTRLVQGLPDYPYSLMLGLPGTILYYYDCQQPQSSSFPAYDI